MGAREWLEWSVVDDVSTPRPIETTAAPAETPVLLVQIVRTLRGLEPAYVLWLRRPFAQVVARTLRLIAVTVAAAVEFAQEFAAMVCVYTQRPWMQDDFTRA